MLPASGTLYTSIVVPTLILCPQEWIIFKLALQFSFFLVVLIVVAVGNLCRTLRSYLF